MILGWNHFVKPKQDYVVHQYNILVSFAIVDSLMYKLYLGRCCVVCQAVFDTHSCHHMPVII